MLRCTRNDEQNHPQHRNRHCEEAKTDAACRERRRTACRERRRTAIQNWPLSLTNPRLFAELFLYLRRAPKPRDWRVLVLYPDLAVERIPRGYEMPVSLPLIHRLDLSALDVQDRSTPGWELLRLIVDETPNALDRARRLLHTPATGPHDPALINFIETILVYKLPRSTREKIQAMLGITDIDPKETRFYQGGGQLTRRALPVVDQSLVGRKSAGALKVLFKLAWRYDPSSLWWTA